MVPFYLRDARELREAEDLMLLMGVEAADEARARSERGRDRGNVAAFCRWRQIGRLIAFLDGDEPSGSLH